MVAPWKSMIPPDDIDIVAPEGVVRCRVKGYYSGAMFVIDDMNVDVRAGDEIRRLLPNGKEETFMVDDPRFYRDTSFGSHYQVKVSRPRIFERHQGGNYTVHVTGQNARVNIQSTDNSSNAVFQGQGNIFSDIKSALHSGISDVNDKADLEKAVSAMEAAQDQASFAKGYQAFIAGAANHMTVITPFLPALTTLLTKFSS